jgi:protein SCO1/2
MRHIILLVVSSVLFAACGGTQETASNSANVKRYDLRGKVVSVDRIKKRASIDHEAIPGFMDAMTMDFPIHETWVWDDLTAGSEIQAELVVDNTAKDPFYLEKIGILAGTDAKLPPPPAGEVPPQVGKAVPDIKLTDQDGKRFSLTDYKGKAVAVTFIYRECPLPDYCIKMSKNFSDAAVRIGADPALKDKVRLLSVSFDPARDTPEKLRQYGQGYLGNPEKPDFSVWRLAVGSDKEVRSIADFFGLKYEVDQNDKAIINHSLVTAVIGPDGTVKKIIAGNRWTVDELVRDLEETVR